MKSNIKHIVTLLFLMLPCLPLSAQTKVEQFNKIGGLINHAAIFNERMPQEKTYLHFDNTGYFKGEHIWFKAYVMRADNGKPSDISHVLYVELLDPSGNIVQKRQLKIEKGEANGDFLLDSILVSGFYEVRAYTRYMLNWGANTAFSRVFPVFNQPADEGDYSHPTIDQRTANRRLPSREQEIDTLRQLPPVEWKQKNAGGYRVNFYPEGGDLVRGLISRVAFDVKDEEGMPVQTHGLIVDSLGNSHTVVGTNADGRGIFEIKPNDSYFFLVLTDEKLKRHSFEFPDVKDEGCVLRMDVTGENLTVLLQTTKGLQGQLLGYSIINRGNVTLADTLTATPSTQIVFDRTKIQPGVNQLTFFNAEGQIFAERLFFICPPINHSDSIRVTSTTSALTPCCPVTVDIASVPNASLSFSAMDAATLTNGRMGNAQTWMLLSSDVKGYIPNPEYYFEADDEQHRLAADTLMMFNGWRRYDWELMTDREPWQARIQQIEDKQYVFGQLRRPLIKWKKKNPVNHVLVSIYLWGQNGYHYRGHTHTDSLGYYAFKLPDLDGEWSMQLQARLKGKLKSYTMTVDRRFAPKARFLSAEEMAKIPINAANLFVQGQAKNEEESSDENEKLRMRVGRNEYVTRTVKIKTKKHFTDEPTKWWYDESRAFRHASFYYNMVEATDECVDLGKITPTLFEWLHKKNPLFEYSVIDNLYSGREIEYLNESTHSLNEGFRHLPSESYRFINYDKRPICWILNNHFYTYTSPREWRQSGSFVTLNHSNQKMPIFIDEIKSVHIVDNEDIAKNYVHSEQIESEHPVCIFVYTIELFSTASNKGVRRTHFSGFNVPSVFEMEDYSKLPVMEDFRRTLFWEPNVKTDKNGKAQLHFFNNSSCKEMYISAEGFAPDGRPLVNE